MKKLCLPLVLYLFLTLWTGPVLAQSAAHTPAHTVRTGFSVPSTCTGEGRTGGVWCEQCGEWIIRPVTLPALGHAMKTSTVQAACGQKGYTESRCLRCGEKNRLSETPALVHWYGDWQPGEGGTHSAVCRRQGCAERLTVPCAYASACVQGQTLAVCPVCGSVYGGAPAARLALSGTQALPQGDLTCFSVSSPLPGVSCAFTLCCEKAGRMAALPEGITLSLPFTLPCQASLVGEGASVLSAPGEELRVKISRGGLFLILCP